MKKFGFLIITILSIFAKADDISVPSEQRVYIEARSPSITDVQFVERHTQKKASVVLVQVADKPERHNGYFMLDMGAPGQETQTLGLTNKDGNSLYGHVIKIPGSKFLALVLFDNASERDQFAERASIHPPMPKNFAKMTPGSAPASAPKKKVSIADQKRLMEMQQQQNEKNRVNMELQISERRQKAIADFDALSSDEKSKRRQKAKEDADDGFKHFQKGDYKTADDLFARSMNGDPTVDQTYFQYAVNLYKQNKFNLSLAYLGAIQGGEVNSTEYSYYVALNHMKFREYEQAIKGFTEIREENNADLSPISAFFAGNLQFQMSRYGEAKENFQFVLDNSKDPQIDKEAEAMIEQITKVEQYLESLKEIFKYTLTAGMIYDEDVLNEATNNSSTNTKGYRALYGGNIYYHLYRTERTQAAVTASFNDMYTNDSSFQADPNLQAADPQVFSLGLPVQTSFEMFKTPISYTFTPGYQSIVMNPDNTTRRQITGTYGISNNVITLPDPKRVSIYNFDISKDYSYLDTRTSSTDSQNGLRWKLETSQIWLMGPNGQNTITGDVALNRFTAEGTENSNDKLDTSVAYGTPGWWGTTTSSKLTYSLTKYPLQSQNRSDGTFVAGILAIKPFGNLSLAGGVDYNMNSSNVDTYTYNKLVVTFVLSYSGSVSRK